MPRMFLNGTAMAGGALHHLVGDAPLVASTTTAARYRFLAIDVGVGGAGDPYPGLQDVGAGAGHAIEGEVYEMSYEQLRDSLLPGEPAGLELGVIELADGSGSLAMVVGREYPALPQAEDISAVGSWRTWRASR